MGRSLLHLLAIANDVQNLSKVLKLISKSDQPYLLLATDIENDWNILHYAIQHFHISFVKTILNSNSPVLLKLLKHKDKNNLTPFDLLHSFYTSFDNTPTSVYSIDSHGNYKSKLESQVQKPLVSESSLFISGSNGEISEFDAYSNMFPPPNPNPLVPMRILKFFTCSSHSALITSTGHLYLTNPQTALFNSSFCRINFFDDLHENGEFPIDASLTSGHTVILTNKNRIFSFGNNIKRLSLYQNSSTFDSYSKNFNSLVPISVNTRTKNQSSLPGSSSSLPNSVSMNNNFNALTALKSFKSLENSDNLLDNESQIIGVTSSNNHTVIYSQHTMNIQGLNVGQFGPLSKAYNTSSAKLEKDSPLTASFAFIDWKYSHDPIKQVLALDSATLILTRSNIIHIYASGLHVEVSLPANSNLKDQWNKFKPRILSMPKSITKLAGPTSQITTSSFLSYSVFILVDTGDIFTLTFPRISTSKDSLKAAVKFKSMWKPTRPEMHAIDITVDSFDAANMSNVGVGAVICTKSGEVFRRTKTKWSRINGASNIAMVSQGYGFSSSNNTGIVTNNPKLVLIREQKKQLMHEIKPSDVYIDFGKLSPLNRSHDVISNEMISEDIHFLKHELTKRVNDEEGYHDDLGPNSDIEFDKKLDRLRFKSDYSIRRRLKSQDLFYDMIFSMNDNNGDYSEFLRFSNYKLLVRSTIDEIEISIPLHKDFIFNRLGFEKSSFHLNRKDLSFDFNESGATIEGNIHSRSVVIFIHYLYTDEVLDIWNDHPGDQELYQLKLGYERLLYSLSPAKLFESISSTFENVESGDVVIKLADGEVRTWKCLLSCRCDYFNLLFQSHWKNTTFADFSHVSKYSWNLVMRYLIGYSNDEIFFGIIKELSESYKAATTGIEPNKTKTLKTIESLPSHLNSHEDFINIVLEILELSNELLLPNLKHYCELSIKDLINFDNYDIMIQHAFNTNSNQLFSNCCWFIFNNLAILYHDARLSPAALGEQCFSSFESRVCDLLTAYIPSRGESKPEKTDTFKIHKRKILRVIDDINEENNHSICDVELFLNNIDRYNEYYLHPLLWKLTGKFYSDEEAEKHTFKPRKKSMVRSDSDVYKKTFLSDTRTLSNEMIERNESAIFDDYNDSEHSKDYGGFITVTKNRRKSSLNLTNSTTNFNSAKVSFEFNQPLKIKRESSSSSHMVNEPWKIFRKTSVYENDESTFDSGSLRSTSNSRSNSVISVNSNTSAIPVATFDESVLQSTETKKNPNKMKTKSNIAPMKISQKAKKQLEKSKEIEAEKTKKQANIFSNNSNKDPWAIKNAWGLNTPTPLVESSSKQEKIDINTAAMIAPNKCNQNILPSLGDVELLKTKKDKKQMSSLNDRSFNYIPMATAPTIVPSLDLMEINKSIEDQKAEEDFARWWEEESRRIQNSMKKDNNSNSKSNRGNNKGRSRGSGQRGGRGGNRGRAKGTDRKNSNDGNR